MKVCWGTGHQLGLNILTCFLGSFLLCHVKGQQCLLDFRVFLTVSFSFLQGPGIVFLTILQSHGLKHCCSLGELLKIWCLSCSPDQLHQNLCRQQNNFQMFPSGSSVQPSVRITALASVLLGPHGKRHEARKWAKNSCLLSLWMDQNLYLDLIYYCPAQLPLRGSYLIGPALKGLTPHMTPKATPSRCIPHLLLHLS